MTSTTLTNFRKDQLNFEPRFNKLVSLLNESLPNFRLATELFLEDDYASFASSVSIRGIHFALNKSVSSTISLGIYLPLIYTEHTKSLNTFQYI